MDPNPIKHPAVLLARVRDEIAPVLSTLGFHFDSRNKPSSPAKIWIDYRRQNEIISLRWDQWVAKLSVEMLDSRGCVKVIAEVTTARVQSYEELMARVEPFIEHLKTALVRFAGPSDASVTE